MSDPYHHYAAGAERARFSVGPVERLRTRFGTGTLAPSNLTEEGAKARSRTSDGPAERMASESANEWRKQHPRIVRVEEERVHDAPDAIVAERPDLLLGGVGEG